MNILVRRRADKVCERAGELQGGVSMKHLKI